MYLNIYETRQRTCLKIKIYMKCHNYVIKVKFNSSVLHFDKVIPLCKYFNLHTINTRQFVRSAL